ncbi:hypothetical protein JTB14_024421 [Gonioctena quinquepunctata]|nr:hypothetical protein JTB14_024421 [Gonioctena quinquepunctata]
MESGTNIMHIDPKEQAMENMKSGTNGTNIMHIDPEEEATENMKSEQTKSISTILTEKILSPPTTEENAVPKIELYPIVPQMINQNDTPNNMLDQIEGAEHKPVEGGQDITTNKPIPIILSRNPEVQDTTDKEMGTLMTNDMETTEPRQLGLKPNMVSKGSEVGSYSENEETDSLKINVEKPKPEQQIPIEMSLESMIEYAQPIPSLLSRGTDIHRETNNGINNSEAEKKNIDTRSLVTEDHSQTPEIDTGTEQQIHVTATESQIQEKSDQGSNAEQKNMEETTEETNGQYKKPSLVERIKQNFHNKIESEEDEPKGPIPCTCGVFLSGQFKKGSKQQPKGLPLLTQEMDTPFMNNAMGTRQCTNKCLELIIKHLPKSSEIICATVERENVFKERAYLFVKNHSDKWHGTNLSAGREFCCRDNYTIQVSSDLVIDVRFNKSVSHSSCYYFPVGEC